jgi:hypothetical protein
MGLNFVKGRLKTIFRFSDGLCLKHAAIFCGRTERQALRKPFLCPLRRGNRLTVRSTHQTQNQEF